jgi:hypothetical protein
LSLASEIGTLDLLVIHETDADNGKWSCSHVGILAKRVLAYGLERASELNGSRAKMTARSFSGFNVFGPWREVAASTVSFSLLFPVPSFSVVRFEYFFVYVSLHSA